MKKNFKIIIPEEKMSKINNDILVIFKEIKYFIKEEIKNKDQIIYFISGNKCIDNGYEFEVDLKFDILERHYIELTRRLIG